MDVDTARKTWEVENNVQADDSLNQPADDSIYHYDKDDQQAEQQRKPWVNDPHHFKKVRLSSLALLKMTMHARSGGNLEVMGLMQGKIKGDTFIVMDAFALPVEGTETRVNAQAEAYEYMVEYMRVARTTSRLENAVGWYHSHPGYGCWLSGIDVGTQKVNQEYQEPWLAVVIDPTRTVAAGKVEIGAFRTYPAGYTPPNASRSEYQTIPIDKIKDFGVHESQYYPLEISYFKSSLDTKLFQLLWNKYWVSTLSSSPLLANSAYVNGQIRDLANKLEQAQLGMPGSGKTGVPNFFQLTTPSTQEESPLNKITRDSINATLEHVRGLVSQVVKAMLFNAQAHHKERVEGEGLGTDVTPMQQ